MATFFNEYFGIDAETLDGYGALNISIINDLPLFIDPFLLFNSEKNEYRALHDAMIKITEGSHLEKVCLISDGVGRDNISDFTTSAEKVLATEYMFIRQIADIQHSLFRVTAFSHSGHPTATRQRHFRLHGL